NFENFKRLEIVDKQKLKVVLSERLVQDLYLLTEYPILQQSVYDSLDLCANFTFEQLYLHYDSVKTQELETWCTKMNGNYFSTKIENIKGAGPYKLKIWENDRLVFERKSDHWTQSLSQWLNHSHAQEIVFRLNNDYNSKVLELKNQLVDVSIDFSSKELAELMTDTGITNYYNIHAEPAYSTTLMALNLKPELTNRSPIFTNKKVREAFANSLPVQDVIDKHSNGNAVRIASFVSINKAEYNSELSPYAYDIERAKALLKQAGWIDTDSDGVLDKLIDGKKVDLEVTIVFPPSPLVKTIITMLKEGIEKAGFRVVFENGQNWRNILFNTMEFDAAFFAITNSPGPNYAYSLVLTDAFRNGMNLSGYSNPKVDSIITLADQTFNKAKRDKFILELQKILYQDIPYIYITTGKKAVVVKKGFENVKTNGAHPMILLNTLKFKTNGAE
ncbi:MAG: ABC transporter substrate-binding protein, partial [Bacteroidia bacterium]